jgi:hypothetical protein
MSTSKVQMSESKEKSDVQKQRKFEWPEKIKDQIRKFWCPEAKEVWMSGSKAWMSGSTEDLDVRKQSPDIQRVRVQTATINWQLCVSTV